MSTNASNAQPSIDFAVAKIRHSSWKPKLRRFLDGLETLTLDQATDHQGCDVGRWLHEPTTGGLAKWGSLAEIRELDAAHTKMHASVRRIIQAMEAGNPADAEREFKTADELSQRVIALLGAIEPHVMKKAA